MSEIRELIDELFCRCRCHKMGYYGCGECRIKDRIRVCREKEHSHILEV